MSQIPNIFFKEEQLEEIYTKKEGIKVPTNQTQYQFDTKDNLESFIRNQFPTDEEYANYKEYRRLWHYRAKNFEPGEFPLAVCAELVSTCNLSCGMCYTITDEFKNTVLGAQRMLPWKTVKSIIDECSEMGVYSMLFSWRGEPTLYKSKDENGKDVNIADVFRYARKKGILEITAITHGQEIDEKLARDIIDAEPSWLSFSFDGIKEKYNAIRTPTKWKGKDYDAFAIVSKNIKRFIEIRNEQNKSRPQVRSNTIFPPIAHNPQEYYDTLKALGVDMVTVNELLDLRDGKPKDDMINMDWACQYPFQRLSVSANGVILPCTGAHKEEEGLVLGLYEGTPQKKLRHVDGTFQDGDSPHHTIKSAWKCEKLKKIRYLHTNGRRCEIEPGCRNCSHGVKKYGHQRLHDKRWSEEEQAWTTRQRHG